MSLPDAIDALISFVKSHDRGIKKKDQEEYNRLSLDVVIRADLMDLGEHLPKREGLPSVNFLGLTNLPGNYRKDGAFIAVAQEAWIEGVLALRKLAEAKRETPDRPAILDVAPDVRQSHPDLAHAFDQCTALMETLVEVWKLGSPLLAELTRNDQEKMQHWLDGIERLPGHLRAAETAVSPLLHDIVKTSAMPLRLFAIERAKCCELLLEAGEFTTEITRPVRAFRERGDQYVFAGARNGVIATLQTYVAQPGSSISWDNLRPILRDEFMATAQHRTGGESTFTPIRKDDLLKLLGIGKNTLRKWLDENANDVHESKRTAKRIEVRTSLLDNLKAR